MRNPGAVSVFSLIALLIPFGGSAALAQVYPPAIAPPPADPYAGDGRNGYYDPNGAEPYDPNLLPPEEQNSADLDYDVAYDDSVAQSYDDGYDPRAYQQFEETLAPYGSWVDDPEYGRVWQPSSSVVGSEFCPYASNGSWVLTEFGWTWNSGWDWGWAPFHYGRWTMMANRGWGWIPGTIWGPAWVSWRSGGGYVGWAPLPPRQVTIGSPLGVRSPWRFTTASNFGQPRGYPPSRTVPRVFGRMSVVSNARELPISGATVRVNAGPTRIGGNGRGNSGAPVMMMATAAPHALPRIAIQPRAGAPIAARPWVQSGFARSTPYAPPVHGYAPAINRGSSAPAPLRSWYPGGASPARPGAAAGAYPARAGMTNDVSPARSGSGPAASPVRSSPATSAYPARSAPAFSGYPARSSPSPSRPPRPSDSIPARSYPSSPPPTRSYQPYASYPAQRAAPVYQPSPQVAAPVYQAPPPPMAATRAWSGGGAGQAQFSPPAAGGFRPAPPPAFHGNGGVVGGAARPPLGGRHR
jgi:hypothetical protein